MEAGEGWDGNMEIYLDAFLVHQGLVYLDPLLLSEVSI